MEGQELNTQDRERIQQSWEAADSVQSHLDALLLATPHPVEKEAPHDKYLPINQSRVRRIRKHLTKVGLNEGLLEAISKVAAGSRMLVLNEFWCGDGAQILPVHEAVVALSEGALEARVLLRDQHDEVMSMFLTNGARSIPKTVLLDSQCRVLGTWGPRPSEAMELVRRLKSNPETAPTYNNDLHKWYAHDRQHAIQREMAVLLRHAQGA